MKPVNLYTGENLEETQRKLVTLVDDIYNRFIRLQEQVVNFDTGENLVKTVSVGASSDAVTTHETTYDHSLLHTQNTDTQLDSGVVTVNASDHVAMSSSELSIKVYKQDAEPTLSADDFCAFWEDTNDSDRTYLVFRRGTGDQVKIELT